MINQFRKGNKNSHNKTRKQQKTTFLIKRIVKWWTWGMARLAMVRPEITSDLKSLRSYWEPHVNIGNKLWRPRITLFLHVWFLNLSNGSSGKKTSAKRFLSFWNVVFLGGRQTLCISTIVSLAVAVLGDVMSSTLFVPWPMVFKGL